MSMLETAKKSQTMWITDPKSGDIVFHAHRKCIQDPWNGTLLDERLISSIQNGTLMENVDARQCIVSFTEQALTFPQILTLVREGVIL